MFVPSPPITELNESTQRGRRFTPVQERELDPALRALALRLPGAREGLVLAPEFRGARGVVDLLAVTRVGDKFTERTRIGAPFVTSEANSAVLARLSPRVTRSPRYIARAVGMTERQTLTRLRVLARTGAAAQVGSGFRRRVGFDPIGRSYALEAKVDDWKKGLSQALRYASWADAAGVVLLVAPQNLTSVKARFRALKIGLAIGDSWIVRPVIGRPDPGRRMALSEQLSLDIGEALKDGAMG